MGLDGAARPPLARIAHAGLWLGSQPLVVWSTRLKPDLVAVAFALAAVYLADGWRLEPRTWRALVGERRLWLVVACVTLAFFSKQSAIAGGLAIGVWLLGRDWRRAVVYGVAQTAALAGPFALLDLATSHGFSIHMVDYHALPWSAGRWLGILGDMAGFHAALAVLALGYSVWAGRRWQLPALYSAAATLATFSGGTFGGFHNHALEFLAALCLGAGLAVAELGTARPLLRLAALAVVAAQVACFWITPGWLAFELQNVPNPAITKRLLAVQQLVRNQPGEVWGDNLGLIVMAGKPVRFNDPLVMAQAAQLGWWDETTFTRLIDDRHFDLVLWRNDVLAGKRPNNLSPAQFAALQGAYHVLYRDTPLVYAPAPR